MTELKSQRPWRQAASGRRLVLLLLMLLPSIVAAQIMYSLLPPQSGPLLNILLTILFGVLFSWISVGFWSAAAGALVLLRRCDRFSVNQALPPDPEPPCAFRTAIVFPIYNEDVRKVAEGVRVTLRSLRDCGQAERFDIFILSDSTDPDIWVAEEEAWQSLCVEEEAFGQIFYRHRRFNLKRKSGNIADFCRRWGAKYRYMVVFDADSLMSGPTLSRMVAIMQAHPRLGILQTPPKAIESRSLLARVQQFANHLYGPLFAAGFHYWQLGEAQYWGHNAIIRIEPFMRHCQLARLPGKAPLGGEILSHDFVESALMRRAGYEVWLAYDLQGSWEQCPPSLIDELARDRRWCQGNLQHSRLIFTKGFFPTHRALFINGIMSYGSALLWFFFLVAGSFEAASILFFTPSYFPEGPSLFPDWPRYFPRWALAILSGTAGLLFMPKILALALTAAKGGLAAFGGLGRATLSVLGEVLISTFLAPVRMIYHSLFVVSTLVGFKVGWNAQNRDDSSTRWSEALRFHWWGMGLGLLWGLAMYIVNPGFFLWLSPVAAGLMLSAPLSVWTSRVSWGEAARRWGLFLSPPETEPEREICLYREYLAREPQKELLATAPEEGFRRALLLGRVLKLHLALAPQRGRLPEKSLARLEALRDKALNEGPQALSAKEKMALLNHRPSLELLHKQIWRLEGEAAARWGLN